MKMTKSTLAGSALLALILACSSYFWLYRRPNLPQLGTQIPYVFSFELSEQKWSDIGQALLGGQTGNLVQDLSQVEGRLFSEVVKVEGTRLRFRSSIQTTQVRLPEEQSSLLARDLNQSFEWEQNWETGTIDQLTLRADMSPVGKTFLKGLLSRLQIPHGNLASTTTYRDIFGAYRLLLPASDQQKQGEARWIIEAANSPSQGEDMKRDGSCTATYLKAHSTIEKLDCQEEQKISAGTKILVQRRWNVVFSQVAQTQDYKVASLPPPSSSQTLKDLSLDDERRALERKANEQTVGGRDFSQYFQDLIQRSQDAKDILDDKDYLILKAFLELHPELAKVLAEEVKNRSADDGLFKTVVDLLGAVGHDEAQAALTSLIDTKSESDRDLAAIERLVPSLGLVVNPSPATEKYLTAMRNHEWHELASAATLSLGVVGARLRDNGNQEAYRRVVTILKADYEAIKDPGAASNVLTALGNTGASENLDIAKGLLDPAKKPSHAIAMEILRFVPDEEAKLLLTDHVLARRGEERYQACQALAYQTLGLAQLEALHKSMKTWTSSDEKSFICLVDIWQKAFQRGQVEIASGSLLWIQNRGPSPQVQDLAKATLLGLNIRIRP